MKQSRDGCAEDEGGDADDTVEKVVVSGADDDNEDQERVEHDEPGERRAGKEPDHSDADENRDGEVLAGRRGGRVLEERGTVSVSCSCAGGTPRPSSGSQRGGAVG